MDTSASPPGILPVRYNPPAAWTFLAIGVLDLLLGLLLGSWINLVIGVLLTVLGALCLSRTYFTYDTGTRTLEVIAPIGTRRTFRGSGPDALVVEGNRIVLVRAGGKRKKLPVSRWMSRPDEWAAVVRAIGGTPTGD